MLRKTEDSLVSAEITELMENYEKKIYDLRQLMEITKALNSNLDYNSLIDAILNSCLAQLQTMKAAIFLAPDVDSDHLKLEAGARSFDFSDSEMELKIFLESNIMQHFGEKHRSFYLKEFEARDPSISSDEMFQLLKNKGVEMLSPMSSKGKINGILILGEKMTQEEYTDSDKQFLSSLAGIAGIAVENARLYELATVDMMTQLKVHHYFQTKLREEMDRSRKKGTKLALLFTDVDKFKVFNDTYGHQAGDVVLIEVAKCVMECCRKQDIAARYGGEEFCVIMPGAGTEEGFELGEKIRTTIEKHSVKNPNTGEPLKVTISVGVTEFHPLDKNNKEMIERSDQALYKAKHAGRNKTVTNSKPN